jgi:hypothetical protein
MWRGRLKVTFEISHKRFGPTVERINNHFTVSGSCNLHSAVFQPRTRDRTCPRRFVANSSGLRGEVKRDTGVETTLCVVSGVEEALSSRLESPVKGREELEGTVSKDF